MVLSGNDGSSTSSTFEFKSNITISSIPKRISRFKLTDLIETNWDDEVGILGLNLLGGVGTINRLFILLYYRDLQNFKKK